MKPNEEKLRAVIDEGRPFTIVTDSGQKINVRGRDWIFLQPLDDDLPDEERTDFFQVWGNGKAYRWIAFASISIIEAKAP